MYCKISQNYLTQILKWTLYFFKVSPTVWITFIYFNSWIHFWNASWYVEETYEAKLEPSACRDLLRWPHKNFLSFRERKKSHGDREYGGCSKTVTFADFKNCCTSSDVCDGALSWGSGTCLNPDKGRRLWSCFLSFLV